MRKVTRNGKVVVHFPTDQAADKWNKRLETQIRHLGHLGTAVMTVIVTLATKNPAIGIGVGTGTAIGKDELQARIEYPYARRGWRIEVLSTTTYEQNALSKDYIVFSYGYVGYNHQGVQQYRKKGLLGGRIEVGQEMNRIPKDVALQMVARSSKTTQINYK